MGKYFIDFITKEKYKLDFPSRIYKKSFQARGREVREVYTVSCSSSDPDVGKRFEKRYKQLYGKPKLFSYYDDRKPVINFFVRIIKKYKYHTKPKIHHKFLFEILSNLDVCEYIDGYQDWIDTEVKKYKKL